MALLGIGFGTEVEWVYFMGDECLPQTRRVDLMC